ncbi:MAG: hypothetical protein FWE37_00130 [Spirochaetaceae bacterium]|nr:hypothetical protein [Spirochaetaceae bacterium]
MKALLLPFTLSLYVTLAVYLIINLIYGNFGLTNYNLLAADYNLLTVNHNELIQLQTTLIEHHRQLEQGDEALILAARSVGFFQEGEERIIVPNLRRMEDFEIGRTIHLELNNTNQLPPRWLYLIVFTLVFSLFCFVVPLRP